MFPRGGKNCHKVPQETQSPATKLFRRMDAPFASTETVNRWRLLKKLKKALPENRQESPDDDELPACMRPYVPSPTVSSYEMGNQTSGPGLDEHRKQRELKQQQQQQQPQYCCTKKQSQTRPPLQQQHSRRASPQQSKIPNKHYEDARGVHMKSADDTYSYTSCTLKKIIVEESPKLIIGLIVIVGLLLMVLLWKCFCFPDIISELPETRERRSDDAVSAEDSKPWETFSSKLTSENSDLTGQDTRETKLRGGDGEYPDYLSPDLASILDPVKVNEGYNSNKLRDFYRKLLKTDIQIKNLKKGFANIKRGNIDVSDYNTPRIKRSLNMKVTTSVNKVPFDNDKQDQDKSKFEASDDWKTIKDIEKIMKHLPETDDKNNAVQKINEIGHGLPAKDFNEDKIKIIIQQDNQTSLYPNKDHKTAKHLRKWLHDMFDNGMIEINSTLYRRLLQHDDEDKGTKHYEDVAKEPWKREKRATTAVEVYIKTNYPELSASTFQPNSELNYLIDAAMKMKKGKVINTDSDGKDDKVIVDKEYFEDKNNYNELVRMAQAYSDYGVLDNKKDTIENYLVPENAPKVISSKTEKTMKWFYNNFDTSRGHRFKLKSSVTSKESERKEFTKNLRHINLKKKHNLETNNNVLKATNMPSNIEIDKSPNATHISDDTATVTKLSQKTTTKHKERNMLFSGHRRSLKSIEIDESNLESVGNDSDFNNTALVHIEDTTKYENNNIVFKNKIAHNNTMTKIDNETLFSVHQTQKILNVSEGSVKANNSNTSQGLVGLFRMLADFSMFMTGFDTNQEDSGYRFLYDIVTMLNPNDSPSTKNTSPEGEINSTRASVEKDGANIGHRSRRLMSYEEVTETSGNITTSTSSEKIMNESYVVTNRNSNITTEINKANTSNIENKIKEGNRTVVKRSADGDSIFWNDMYDDEYGIKDPMEDDMKDKSVVKINDLIGKDNWINLKFKKIAKSFKNRRNRKGKNNRNHNIGRNKTVKINKRSVFDISGRDETSKTMFDTLSANVKRVCQEAAQAVLDTTNKDARIESDQASTLMQQLIGLLSELVDLQVREKTCIQLPEDLRSFLAWLTSPDTDERPETGFTVDDYKYDSMLNLHSVDDFASSNARSDCLGTIHDVEDLIMQYDEMSEEDKSKMSGVREYLENQLHYLHKQLSTFNEYGSLFLYQDPPIRMRRQSKRSFRKRKPRSYKFLNYYNKKHTKYTEPDDSTEDYRLKKNQVTHENKVKRMKNEDRFDNSEDNKYMENRSKRTIDKNIKDFKEYLSGLVKYL